MPKKFSQEQAEQLSQAEIDLFNKDSPKNVELKKRDEELNQALSSFKEIEKELNVESFLEYLMNEADEVLKMGIDDKDVELKTQKYRAILEYLSKLILLTNQYVAIAGDQAKITANALGLLRDKDLIDSIEQQFGREELEKIIAEAQKKGISIEEVFKSFTAGKGTDQLTPKETERVKRDDPERSRPYGLKGG